jgi:hypothetical protein
MQRQWAAFAYSLALSEETSVLAIARRAYCLWEKEGRPENSALRHWLQAESEIARELAEAIVQAPRPPRTLADPAGFTTTPADGRSG